MDIGLLITLQLSMYTLVAVGFFLSKKGMLTEENEQFLSNLLLKFILPCSIVKSFLITFNTQMLRQFRTFSLPPARLRRYRWRWESWHSGSSPRGSERSCAMA